MKDKCKEKVFENDIGDGYSDTITCGGTYEKIGNTQLAQCDTCKKVKELSTQPSQE